MIISDLLRTLRLTAYKNVCDNRPKNCLESYINILLNVQCNILVFIYSPLKFKNLCTFILCN